eukprot:56083-Rhodomonas_salina.1
MAEELGTSVKLRQSTMTVGEQRAARSRVSSVRDGTGEDPWTTRKGSRGTTREQEQRAVTSRALRTAARERLEQRAASST